MEPLELCGSRPIEYAQSTGFLIDVSLRAAARGVALRAACGHTNLAWDHEHD